MQINAALFQAILTILAGVLILVQPKLLNYVVAFYLIIIGAMGLLRVMGVA
jgi:multisubunit Na+/H+ antiporter MnhC subunit